MNCRCVVPVVVALVGVCIAGCNSKEDTPQEVLKPSVPVAKKIQVLSEAEKKEFASAFRSKVLKSRYGKSIRKKVLNELHDIKKWKISTVKNEKEDEIIAAAIKNGVYDRVIKEALTDVVYLNFFTRLPNTIRALREVDPVPETCDFTLEDPRPAESIFREIGKEDWTETETIPEIGEIVWFRFGEVSFGVADEKIQLVRVHVTDNQSLWANVGNRP